MAIFLVDYVDVRVTFDATQCTDDAPFKWRYLFCKIEYDASTSKNISQPYSTFLSESLVILWAIKSA